jgi:hypothetical protein
MMNGRKARTRSGGATKSKGGRRQKDHDGHSMPGQDMSDAKPSTWPARTGYTSQSRQGAGKHGVKVKVGGY